MASRHFLALKSSSTPPSLIMKKQRLSPLLLLATFMPTRPWLFSSPLGWYDSRALISLKSEPSGFSCSPSLREFRISLTRPLRAAMLRKRCVPTRIGRLRSFCLLRDSLSRLSLTCLGMSFSACCSKSPWQTSHFSLAPPISKFRSSKNCWSLSKGETAMKLRFLSLTSLTNQSCTFAGSFSLSFSFTCVQLCSSGIPERAAMTPPSWAWMLLFFWCVGLASSLGSAALPGLRTAVPPSRTSIFDSLRASITSSLVARMACILLQLSTSCMSNHPSLSAEIFSLKNLSYRRFSSLR
mmetsp:Transcript_38594/g.115271  ORF Transcript_38594/g.115271 Transcript_38594/m.115271 type:complete len:296 (+) Transcript_38594:144-1031(+)